MRPGERYVFSARVLHWAMALGFVIMWASGYSMKELVENGSALEKLLFDVHFTSGVTLLVLLVLRIVVRLRNQPPPLSLLIRNIERTASRFSHMLLYILPAAIILIGYAETNISGYAVRWFGMDLPKVLPAFGEPLGEIVIGWLETLHRWFAYTMLGVAVVHVAGALKHRWIDRNDVIYRMALWR